MRLGQIARKYDLPVQSIIDFLEKETGEKIHPNSKIFEAMEAKIAEQFGLTIEDELEISVIPKQASQTTEEEKEDESAEAEEPEVTEDRGVPASDTQPLSAAEEIALVEGEIAIGEPVIVSKEPVEEKPPPPKEEEIIQSDKLIEMIESEEKPTDLEQIKLIKAPKKELPGLKVLGKVELPEERPKKESKKNDTQQHRNRKPQLSEEEKEKRRLAAKRKREAAEARKEKQHQAQEAKRLKALKAKHYEEKLKKTEKQAITRNTEQAKPEDTPTSKPTKPSTKPKTLLGKWWRWMNT